MSNLIVRHFEVKEPIDLADVTGTPYQELRMAKNKDPNKTRPGEMPEGTFHYNPGNMSGKKIGNAERHEDDVAVPLDQGAKETKEQP